MHCKLKLDAVKLLKVGRTEYYVNYITIITRKAKNMESSI